MATNFVQPGAVVEVEAPSGGVSSGDLVVLTQLFGVATMDAASGDAVNIACGGVWDLTKINAASTSMAVGANVHWDATNAQATVSATSNLKIGVALAAAANTDTTVRVRLNDAF